MGVQQTPNVRVTKKPWIVTGARNTKIITSVGNAIKALKKVINMTGK